MVLLGREPHNQFEEEWETTASQRVDLKGEEIKSRLDSIIKSSMRLAASWAKHRVTEGSFDNQAVVHRHLPVLVSFEISSPDDFSAAICNVLEHQRARLHNGDEVKKMLRHHKHEVWQMIKGCNSKCPFCGELCIF
jgi:hypothetical protein